MMNIDYADFEKHMGNIVRILQFENSISELCCQMYKERLDCEIRFPTLIEDVVDLLAMATQDKYNWISYWLFELDCGEKYKDGMITDADGNIIKLQTIHDLWGILLSETSGS